MSDSNASIRSRGRLLGARDVVLENFASLVGVIAPPMQPELSARASCAQDGAIWQGIDLSICDDLSEVAASWKVFQASAARTPFQTFIWLDHWQRHIGNLRGTLPAIVTVRDGAGEILLMLPLAIENLAGLRRLTWLGYELCDYNVPLLAPQFSGHPAQERFPALWQRIVRQLRADPRYQFDIVDLRKMPETVGGQPNPFLSLATLHNPSGAYVANLSGNWDEFYAAKRSGSTRQTERRQLKQLAKFGEIKFVDVQDPSDIARTFDILFAQKSRAFARMGVDNMFARPGCREFFRAVATDADARGFLHVSRLDIGSEAGSTSLGMQYNGSYYFTLSSYNDGEMSRCGPGRAHLYRLIEQAIERGDRYFDFTIGDEPYKFCWADQKLTLHDHLTAVTWRGQIAVAAMVAFSRVKRFIKQTPWLWQAFSKSRALIGALKNFGAQA